MYFIEGCEFVWRVAAPVPWLNLSSLIERQKTNYERALVV